MEKFEQYKLFYENSPLPYQSLDEQGFFIDINPAWIKTLGYKREKVINKSFTDFLRQDHKSNFEKNFSEFKRCGYIKDAHYKIKHNDGHYLDISFQGSIARNSNGQFLQTCCALKDITHQKRKEKQSHRRQKTESLRRMAGAVAHHFNNMLAVIIGNLQLAKEDLPRDMNIFHNIITAETAAHRASEMSKLMLSYLGQQKGTPEVIDLSKIINKNLEQLCVLIPPQISLNTNFSTTGAIIKADRKQIEQILAALITNSWEAMEEDLTGIITVSTDIVTTAGIDNENRFPVDWNGFKNKYACLKVTDTGKGMTDETIGGVFDPFFSDKFTGRGLGLPIALGNIKNLDGCITVDSKLGHGSTFKIFIPLQEDINYIIEKKETQHFYASPTETTILLVEDQPSVLEIAQTMLEYFGYNVIPARDGVHALEIFRKHEEEIKLVISDLTMPRMNGLETLGAIRSIQPEIRFILMSGYSDVQSELNSHRQKPQAFLTKPYQMKILKETIEQVLSS